MAYRGGRGGGSHLHHPYVRPQNGNAIPKATPRFEVDKVTFELVQNGTKLKRITPFSDDLPTPMKHEIGGMKFYRTKGGNLLRHKEYLKLQEKK